MKHCDTKYLDGYTPYEIIQAAHKSVMRRYEERKAMQEAMQIENEITEIKVTSEVKVK